MVKGLIYINGVDRGVTWQHMVMRHFHVVSLGCGDVY